MSAERVERLLILLLSVHVMPEFSNRASMYLNTGFPLTTCGNDTPFKSGLKHFSTVNGINRLSPNVMDKIATAPRIVVELW